MGSSEGLISRLVRRELWELVIMNYIFVDTRRRGEGILNRSREEMLRNGHLEWVTHCYLMYLPFILKWDETQEIEVG